MTRQGGRTDEEEIYLQRIQAVICFLLLLCVFVPFGAVAISPGMVRDLIVLVTVSR